MAKRRMFVKSERDGNDLVSHHRRCLSATGGTRILLALSALAADEEREKAEGRREKVQRQLPVLTTWSACSVGRVSVALN